MTRPLLALILLLLATLPADAQLVGDRLYAQGFRSVVYVCGTVGTTCRATFDPTRSDYFGRYGHAVTASKGSLSGERCGGFDPPNSWLHQALDLPALYRPTNVDKNDLLYVSRGGQRPACDELQGVGGAPDPVGCSLGGWWRATPLGITRDQCRVILPGTYLDETGCCGSLAPSGFSQCVDTPQCWVEAPVEPTDPEEPEEPGDPVDPEPVEPGCGAALDALVAAVAEVQRECRP